MGTIVWNHTYGSGYNDPANAGVVTFSNGDCVFAAGLATDNNLSERPYLVRIDPSGSTVWHRTYGSPEFSTQLFAPKEVPSDGGVIAAGLAYYDHMSGLLLRTTAAGDSLWMRTYYYFDSLMTDGLGEFTDVQPTLDGGFIAAGYTHGSASNNSPPGYGQDAWVVKVDSMGCLVPGCDDIPLVTQQVTNLSGSLTLYPNPVPSDQWLQIRIDLPSSFHPAGPLVLSITGPDGKLIKQQLVASSSDLEQISLTSLRAGTYALHLSDAHTWIAGKKFVVY